MKRSFACFMFTMLIIMPSIITTSSRPTSAYEQRRTASLEIIAKQKEKKLLDVKYQPTQQQIADQKMNQQVEAVIDEINAQLPKRTSSKPSFSQEEPKRAPTYKSLTHAQKLKNQAKIAQLQNARIVSLSCLAVEPAQNFVILTPPKRSALEPQRNFANGKSRVIKHEENSEISLNSLVTLFKNKRIFIDSNELTPTCKYDKNASQFTMLPSPTSTT